MTSPHPEAAHRKSELRRQCRDARSKQSDADRRNASARIADHVVSAGFFRGGRLIACYLPMPDEVDTRPIIERAWRMKKRIFVPITCRDRTLKFRELRPESELKTTNFGLIQPVSGDEIAPRDLDIVLTPLVAFDDDGERIGMGGGYYDRSFSFLRSRQAHARPKLVGVAFAFQRVGKIAANPWDIRLSRVITELG